MRRSFFFTIFAISTWTFILRRYLVKHFASSLSDLSWMARLATNWNDNTRLLDVVLAWYRICAFDCITDRPISNNIRLAKVASKIRIFNRRSNRLWFCSKPKPNALLFISLNSSSICMRVRSIETACLPQRLVIFSDVLSSHGSLTPLTYFFALVDCRALPYRFKSFLPWGFCL